MTLIEHILLLTVSFISNTLSAMAGGGAGLLQFPILIFLGLGFSTALSTHKIATVALGFGATLKHGKNKNIDFKFAAFILACGLPGVVIGVKVVVHIPEAVGEIILGILTISIGLYSLNSKELGITNKHKNMQLWEHLLGGAGLFLLGIFNGSLTSGTGLFVTFWLVRWFKLPFKQATAYTMILVGLFWNGSGAFTLALNVTPQWNWLPALLIGSAIGGYIGAHLAQRFGNKVIKKVFEVITVCVGLLLCITAYNSW